MKLFFHSFLAQPEVSIDLDFYQKTTENTWTHQHTGSHCVSQTVTGDNFEALRDQAVELPVEFPVDLVAAAMAEKVIEENQEKEKTVVEISEKTEKYIEENQAVIEENIEPIAKDSKSDVKIVLSYENDANEVETRTISDENSDSRSSSEGKVFSIDKFYP